jgi:hypothetical protein
MSMSSPTHAKFQPLLKEFAMRARKLNVPEDALMMLTHAPASWKVVGTKAQCDNAVATAVELLRKHGDPLKVAEFVSGAQYGPLRKEMAEVIKKKVAQPEQARLLSLIGQT